MPIIPDLPPDVEPAALLRSVVRPGNAQDEVRLELFAGTDPRVDCSFVVETSPGLAEPYDIHGAELEFVRKARRQDPDPPALHSTADGSIAITSGAGGRASIQFVAADLPRAGQFRFHLDAVRDNQRVTLAWGQLSVRAR